MVVKEVKEDTAIFAASTREWARLFEDKIARDKAINVDPSVSMYEESLRVQESKLLPIQEPVHLKSPSHCKFSDCQNQRKGYSDFCREHKAIGKVIAGKIAREKAIAKIAERDNLGQVTETNPTDYSANMDYNSGIELEKMIQHLSK